jgi:hypothetical protein
MEQDSHVPDPLPLEAFFGENDQVNPAARDLIVQADLVIGVDIMTGQEYVVYGKATLKRISESGQAEDVRILRIALDAQTEDLDKLCGLVMLLRGRFDYGKDWESRPTEPQE